MNTVRRGFVDIPEGQIHYRTAGSGSGVPLVLLPFAEQQRFVAAFRAVAPECGFLHYSYCATSPISPRRLGLEARRLAWTPLNFPPASVWHYRHVG